jgi:hypothetical protein
VEHGTQGRVHAEFGVATNDGMVGRKMKMKRDIILTAIER